MSHNQRFTAQSVFWFFQKVLIAQTRLKVLSGDINKMLSVKQPHNNQSQFDYATSNSLFKHFKPSKRFFSFLIARLKLAL